MCGIKIDYCMQIEQFQKVGLSPIEVYCGQIHKVNNAGIDFVSDLIQSEIISKKGYKILGFFEHLVRKSSAFTDFKIYALFEFTLIMVQWLLIIGSQLP